MRTGTAVSGGRARCALLATVICACMAVLAPAAQAFTWSGESTSSLGWSAASNWAGGVAPSPSSTVSLTFPLLRSSCEVAEPIDACYLSEANVSGITAESMQVSDGGEYEIGGDALTLGSGGLTSTPEGTESGFAALFSPLALGASQTWHLAGSTPASLANHLVYLGEALTGSSSALTIDVEKSVELAIGTKVNVGPVSIDGAEAGALHDENAIVGMGGGGSLDSADGNAVSLAHVFFFGSGGIGALGTEGATLAIGSGEAASGRLEAASASLDAATAAVFEAHGTGGTAGIDYSQLVASGPIDLGSAALVMFVHKVGKEACATLPVGQSYTLVSTSGELSGSFGNAPEGGEIPVTYSPTCGSMPAEKLRIAYQRAGGQKTVRGTVIAGVSSTTSLSASSESPVTDQMVTLTATVSAAGVTPSGTVSFEDEGAPLTGCASQPVTPSAGVYKATCMTYFEAARSPLHLSATFAPGAGVDLKGSTSETKAIDVRPAATSTSLSASSSTPAVGQQVLFTAKVAQSVAPVLAGPTGGVTFLDGEAPIGSCMEQPLLVGAGTSTVTCAVTYASVGAHTVTARFAGDANFASSSSSPVSVSVGGEGEHAPEANGGETSGAGGSEAGGGAGANSARGHLRLLVGTAKAKGGAALVKLRCEGGGECAGVLQLVERVSSRRHGRRGRRTVVLGSVRYSITAGKMSTVRIPLDHAGRKALKHAHGHLVATLATKSPKAMLGKVDV